MRRYYNVLDISEDATDAQIKQAYRRKAAATHPDKNPDDPNAAKAFQEVKEAYDCLSDPERKLAYDETGDTSVETGNPAEDLFLHLLNEIVDQHDTVFEALEHCRRVIEQMIDECEMRQDENAKEIVKLNRLQERIRYSGKGVNLVEAVLKDKLISLSKSRTDIESAINAAKGVFAMLKDYLGTDKPARWTDVRPTDLEQKFLKEMGMLGTLLGGPGKRRRGGFPGTGV